jgi:hypothetical protein
VGLGPQAIGDGEGDAPAGGLQPRQVLELLEELVELLEAFYFGAADFQLLRRPGGRRRRAPVVGALGLGLGRAQAQTLVRRRRRELPHLLGPSRGHAPVPAVAQRVPGLLVLDGLETRRVAEEEHVALVRELLLGQLHERLAVQLQVDALGHGLPLFHVLALLGGLEVVEEHGLHGRVLLPAAAAEGAVPQGALLLAAAAAAAAEHAPAQDRHAVLDRGPPAAAGAAAGALEGREHGLFFARFRRGGAAAVALTRAKAPTY